MVQKPRALCGLSHPSSVQVRIVDRGGIGHLAPCVVVRDWIITEQLLVGMSKFLSHLEEVIGEIHVVCDERSDCGLDSRGDGALLVHYSPISPRLRRRCGMLAALASATSSSRWRVCR